MKKIVLIPILIVILSLITYKSYALKSQVNDPILDSIYKIKVYHSTKQISDSEGTGFALSRNIILTNYHVVNTPRAITVLDNRGNEYAARLYSYDIKSDIALLQTSNHLVPLKLENKPPSVKDRIYILKGWAIEKGIILAEQKTLFDSENILKFIMIGESNIDRGDSGSPVVNSEGKVIGIVCARQVIGEKVYSYSIPISESHRIIKSLIEKKPYPHKVLGIDVVALNEFQEGFPGLLVREVSKGAPADGKIMLGDVIKYFNDKEIRIYQDLGYELYHITENPSKATVKVLRDNKLLDIDLDIH